MAETHDRPGRAEDDGAGSRGVEGGAAGKRTRVEAAYPTLARAMRSGGAGGDDAAGPSIHDAATAAVAHKGSGGAVDAGVAAKVGAHLGADFGGVRVHQDALATEASAAMGARAFAHGADVFLGAGESGGDLGLMAHELTHVAQQGAAGQRAPQRKVEVGEANSPAEHEADAVAAAVTGGATPGTLLVDDGPVAPGQMLKSTFMAALRTAVTAAADAELGPVMSAMGCPYIDQYFRRYATRSAAEGEALLRRFAPGVRGVRDAHAMIPVVVERVRAGVAVWRDTGQAPPEIAAMEPGAAAAAGAAAGGAGGAQALRAPDGRETLASLEAELGPGAALDGATASRMSGALGVDVSAARIHTGPVAAAKAAAADAVAFTVGPNIVMGAGIPTAGTLEGDALLAHELAHTVQQADAARDPTARRQPIGGESAPAEAHADGVVEEAAKAEAGNAGKTGADKASLASRLLSTMTTGLQLQRCKGDPAPARDHAPGATPAPAPGVTPAPGPAPAPAPAPGVGAPVDLQRALHDAAAALVDIGGTANAADREVVVTAMMRIPLPGLQALAAAGKRVIVCRNSVTEVREDLRGVRPRGWPEGATWDTVPGLNDPARNRVIIAVRDGVVPPTGAGHGGVDLVLHEVGHAIDDSVGGGSNTQAFLDARTADAAALSAYEGQAGVAGLRETYAESFARFHANDATDAATYPHLHAYWATDPLGQYMRARGGQ